jgi:hypothetical protein
MIYRSKTRSCDRVDTTSENTGFAAPFQVLEALAVAYSTTNTRCNKTEADDSNMASFYCEGFSERLTLIAERSGIIGDAVQFETAAVF